MISLKELLAKQFLEPSHVCDHDFMICAANHTLNDEFKDASEAISYLSKPLYRQAKTLRIAYLSSCLKKNLDDEAYRVFKSLSYQTSKSLLIKMLTVEGNPAIQKSCFDLFAQRYLPNLKGSIASNFLGQTYKNKLSAKDHIFFIMSAHQVGHIGKTKAIKLLEEVYLIHKTLLVLMDVTLCLHKLGHPRKGAAFFMQYQGRHSSSQYDTYIQYGHQCKPKFLNYYVYLENDNWELEELTWTSHKKLKDQKWLKTPFNQSSIFNRGLRSTNPIVFIGLLFQISSKAINSSLLIHLIDVFIKQNNHTSRNSEGIFIGLSYLFKHKASGNLAAKINSLNKYVVDKTKPTYYGFFLPLGKSFFSKYIDKNYDEIIEKFSSNTQFKTMKFDYRYTWTLHARIWLHVFKFGNKSLTKLAVSSYALRMNLSILNNAYECFQGNDLIASLSRSLRNKFWKTYYEWAESFYLVTNFTGPRLPYDSHEGTILDLDSGHTRSLKLAVNSFKKSNSLKNFLRLYKSVLNNNDIDKLLDNSKDCLLVPLNFFDQLKQYKFLYTSLSDDGRLTINLNHIMSMAKAKKFDFPMFYKPSKDIFYYYDRRRSGELPLLEFLMYIREYGVQSLKNKIVMRKINLWSLVQIKKFKKNQKLNNFFRKEISELNGLHAKYSQPLKSNQVSVSEFANNPIQSIIVKKVFHGRYRSEIANHPNLLNALDELSDHYQNMNDVSEYTVEELNYLYFFCYQLYCNHRESSTMFPAIDDCSNLILEKKLFLISKEIIHHVTNIISQDFKKFFSVIGAPNEKTDFYSVRHLLYKDFGVNDKFISAFIKYIFQADHHDLFLEGNYFLYELCRDLKFNETKIPVNDGRKHLTLALINVLSNSKTPIKKLPDMSYCYVFNRYGSSNCGCLCSERHKLNQDLVTKHKFQLVGGNEKIFSWVRNSLADYSWYKRNDFFGHTFFDLFRMKDHEHLSEFYENQAQA